VYNFIHGQAQGRFETKEIIMTHRIISIDGIDVRIIRTASPVMQRIPGMPFARKPCEYRKYIMAQIDGNTIGTLFVSVREAAKAIRAF
jgi:hypothetical protein